MFTNSSESQATFFRAFEPGLMPEARWSTLGLAVDQLGWRISFWPSWMTWLADTKTWILAPLRKVAQGMTNVSQAFTPTRTIYISRKATGSTQTFMNALVTHELTHALRAESYGRWWWTLGYLFSRKFRVYEEAAARASALVMSARQRGLDHIDLENPGLYKDYIRYASRLTKGGWPYFAGSAKWKQTTYDQILWGAQRIMGGEYKVNLAYPLPAPLPSGGS
jgi:hypothetical protein